MKSLFYLWTILCLFGCNSNQASKQTANQTDTVKIATPAFNYPQPPAMITEPNLQHEYIVKHYWDYFDFADTTYVPTSDITEQAWANYLNMLYYLPLNQAQETIKTLFAKSAQSNNKKLFQYFTEMANKYLYDPNSPARNEELYIPILEVMTQTTILSDAEKIRPQTLLKLAYQNRLGTKAFDFQYTDITGRVRTMYQSNADFILLFFNNPDCTSCKEHIEAMRNAPLFNKLIAERRLQILSIFPDQDIEIWKNNRSLYPSTWTVGYDHTFSIGTKYDLKASPTLYLLDRNKVVVLKDATLPLIENYFANH